MAKADAPAVPARSGNVGSPSSRCPPFARRRRIFLLTCVVALVVVAVLANYGPVQAYRDARARLDETTAQVAELEAERIELQSRLGRLNEAGYLESLARQELTYAKPGEYIYVVTGLKQEDTPATEAESTTTATSQQPGPLERLVSGFLGLF